MVVDIGVLLALGNPLAPGRAGTAAPRPDPHAWYLDLATCVAYRVRHAQAYRAHPVRRRADPCLPRTGPLPVGSP
jgi:hypothetical protein